jgi:hypothetical protein
MKLLLEFTNPHGTPRQVELESPVRFVGEALLDATHALIAEHRGHTWRMAAGGEFSRLECNQPAMITLESKAGQRTRAFGPYTSVSSIDGIVYADHEVFAFCDTQLGDWYSHELNEHWSSVVVTRVSG